MSDDCIFCKIIAGQIPSDKVFEDDRVFAFRDIQPTAPTHILVVPKQHIPTLTHLSIEDSALMGHMIYATTQIATQEGVDQGYRLVVNNGEQGGQAVFHVHLHLLGGRRMGWPPG